QPADQLRRLSQGRCAGRHGGLRRTLSRSPQAGLQAGDRLRAADRDPQVLGPDHPSLHARAAARPQGRRGGQFPAAPDRPVHVRGPDPRLPRPRRRGGADRRRSRRAQRGAAVLTVAETSRLQAVADRVAEVADLVTVALDELLPRAEGPEARLTEAMRYAALGPGKRLRPYFALEAA